MTATKIQPGDDTHLTLLMAPHSLNFVTGPDRAALLAYGRDVFAAALDSKCLAQIEEPAHTWPAGLLDRVKSALERIENNHCIRRIPADPTDPDLVLAEVRYLLEGKTPPFWVSKLPQGAAPAALAGPAWGEQQVHALAIHMAASAPPSHKPRDYDADMAWARSALVFIAGHAQAAPALEAPAAPAGWKLVPVQDTPSMWTAGGEAIKSCGGHERDAASLAYKAMLAAAPQAPAAPSYPPAFGPNDWVMSVAGTVVKLSEWEPGAVRARTIYGDAAPAAPAVDASTVADMARALELLVGSDALHSLCEHEGIDAVGRVKGKWSKAAECNARSTLLIHREAIDAAIAAQAKEGGSAA